MPLINFFMKFTKCIQMLGLICLNPEKTPIFVAEKNNENL